MSDLDAIVIGSGPNGLAAAVRLAQAGYRTRVIEAADTPGGGLRSRELTRPGFVHDVCSAVHTFGPVSPYLSQLPLGEHGLEWCYPEVSAAHPLDDRPAALLELSLDDTARSLGVDGPAYRRLVAPFLDDPHGLLGDLLGPLGIPKHPWLLLRFGLRALRSAVGLGARFRTDEARALLAGCAAHSILPLNTLGTGAFGLMFLVIGHVKPWAVARGGSQSIADALVGYFRSLGGEIETGRFVRSLDELPPCRVVLFDGTPRGLDALAGDALPAGYRRRLGRFRYGPGVFKLDWALSGPIPWSDPRCGRASTVHVGGTLEEIALSERQVWSGRAPERPYLILCQQSHFDASRAPAGQHTGYAYCHVPAGCTDDLTEAIEAQVERFAPGFRDCILARHRTSPADLERDNPGYVGGAITGGVADLFQLFTRPVARLDPYSTPNPRLFLCSHSTPPGGGVHGMCGFHAAESAIRRLKRGRAGA